MILSIQSNVIHGHVGNAASLPMYHACGVAAEHLDTVRMAAHPGYGTTARDVTSAKAMRALFDDYLDLPITIPLKGIHTGYFVDCAQVSVTADFIAALKLRRPDITILVDPVIGDKGRVYVDPQVVEAIHKTLLPHATIITPNQFELSYLSDQPVETIQDAKSALQALAGVHNVMMIATGIMGPDEVTDILVDKGTYHHHKAPVLASGVSGAGDAFAAVFLASYLSGKTPKKALLHASSLTYHMVKESNSPLTLNVASGLTMVNGLLQISE